MLYDHRGQKITGQAPQKGASGVKRRIVASVRDETFARVFQDGVRSIAGHPLYLMNQDQLIILSYWLYFTNDLIGGMVEKKTDILCGNGFDVKSSDEEVEREASRFWNQDRINNFRWRQYLYTSWLTVFGELCITVFVRPNDTVRCGFVESYAIERTITDPEDPYTVIGVQLKNAKSSGQNILTTILDPTQPEEALFSERTRQKRAGFTVEGEQVYCFYQCVNPRLVEQGYTEDGPSLRGTPDFLASFDSAADAEEVLFSMRRRADVASRILWDVTYTGASQDDIDDFNENTDIPDEYTINTHNEKIKWELNAPDLRASEHETQFRVIRNHTISGKNAGMPPTWFGDGTDANRANAQEMPFSAIKGFTRRQFDIGGLFEQLISYQLVQKGLDHTLLELIYPTISEKDQERWSNVLTKITSALVIGEDREWLTKDEARGVYRSVWEDYGTELGEYVPDPVDPRMTLDYQRMEELHNVKKREEEASNGNGDRDDEPETAGRV